MSAQEPKTGGRGRHPWRRAALWLGLLAPFFYLSYSFANWLASLRPGVTSIVFAWEEAIPFLPWTIIPYWSINLFYALSFFLAKTPREVDSLGRQLLTAQIVAVLCFILFPLRLTSVKPPHDGGIIGVLFDLLASFDEPFNMTPSLHIAVLTILWVFYEAHLPRPAKPLLHLSFLLIGASVLTTFQHHFIDIPTGVLLGAFCLWLWPRRGSSPLAAARMTKDRVRWRLAALYAAASLIFFAAASAGGGGWLWLAYPALSLLMVAIIYSFLGPQGFGKQDDGRMEIGARLFLAPFHLGAFLNSRLWTARTRPVEIGDGVFLGRIPSRLDRKPYPFRVVIDLAAELPARPGMKVAAFPALDLVPPPAVLLSKAAGLIETERRQGPLLVACALGFSRSAAAVAAWLLRTGRADNVDAAVALLREKCPNIILTDGRTRKNIAEAARLSGGSRS